MFIPELKKEAEDKRKLGLTEQALKLYQVIWEDEKNERN